MKTYNIASIKGPITSEVWDKAETLSIDISPCKEFPCPYKTDVKLLHNDEKIFIYFKTDETQLRAVQIERNSQVCEDSCMEFFLAPDKDDERYFNFEINPIGTLLLYKCTRRIEMIPVEVDEKIFNIKTVITNNGWELYYEIPFAFIKEHFLKISSVMHANFYKCGEKTNPEHYGCWSNIPEYPYDFHTPEYFGELLLEN